MHIKRLSTAVIYIAYDHRTVIIYVSTAIENVEIFFGELDYQVVESKGVFEVVVTKMGFLRSPLFLTLTPLTFEQFKQEGYPLPDEAVFDELNTIDPAECKS